MSTKPLRTTAVNAVFYTTQWSVVLRAASNGSIESTQALEALCAVYWPPLYAYARRDGLSPHDAQDAIQDFVYQLIRRNDLATVSPDKGRFRAFLLVALKNFLVSRIRKEQTLKRGANAQRIYLDYLDSQEMESFDPFELSDQLSPDKAFDRQWAKTIMSLALERLREEHKSPQQARLFAALQPMLADGGRLEKESELASQLGVSLTALASAALRLRRRYRALIEDEVRRTLNRPADLEAELRALRDVWT